MGDTSDTRRDIVTLAPIEFAALMVRIALGVVHISYALLMWVVLGWQDVMTGMQLFGGALLLFGACTRSVAIGLLPVAIAGALAHLETGFGMSVADAVYLAGCVAGQALLASGALRPQERPVSQASGLAIPLGKTGDDLWTTQCSTTTPLITAGH